MASLYQLKKYFKGYGDWDLTFTEVEMTRKDQKSLLGKIKDNAIDIWSLQRFMDLLHVEWNERPSADRIQDAEKEINSGAITWYLCRDDGNCTKLAGYNSTQCYLFEMITS
jgi:hypothetical protein